MGGIVRIAQTGITFDEKISSVCNAVLDCYRKNTDLMKNVKSTEYEVSPVQYWQYTYHISDFITSVVHVEKEALEPWQVYDIVNEVIHAADVLKCSLIKVNDKLFFREAETALDLELPFIASEGQDFETEIMKMTEISLNEEFSGCRTGKQLAAVYVLQGVSYYKVVFAMSHFISDGACAQGLNLLFRSALRNGKLDAKCGYRGYMELIERENQSTDVLDRYVDTMLGINKQLPDYTLSYDKFAAFEIPIDEDIHWLDVILKASFFIGKHIMGVFQTEQVVIKATVNNRDFLGREYRTVLGDCHSNIFIIVRKDQSFPEYKLWAEEYIDRVFRKGHADMKYLRLKDFSLNSGYDKNNKYQILADGVCAAVSVTDAGACGGLGEVLEKLDQLSGQRSKPNTAFGGCYRLCALVYGEKLFINIPDSIVDTSLDAGLSSVRIR